jgi:hypothetical protein
LTAAAGDIPACKLFSSRPIAHSFLKPDSSVAACDHHPALTDSVGLFSRADALQKAFNIFASSFSGPYLRTQRALPVGYARALLQLILSRPISGITPSAFGRTANTLGAVCSAIQ